MRRGARFAGQDYLYPLTAQQDAEDQVALEGRDRDEDRHRAEHALRGDSWPGSWTGRRIVGHLDREGGGPGGASGRARR